MHSMYAIFVGVASRAIGRRTKVMDLCAESLDGPVVDAIYAMLAGTQLVVFVVQLDLQVDMHLAVSRPTVFANINTAQCF